MSEAKDKKTAAKKAAKKKAPQRSTSTTKSKPEARVMVEALVPCQLWTGTTSFTVAQGWRGQLPERAAQEAKERKEVKILG